MQLSPQEGAAALKARKTSDEQPPTGRTSRSHSPHISSSPQFGIKFTRTSEDGLSLLRFNFDIVSLVVSRIQALHVFGILGRSCRALSLVLSVESLWKSLLEIQLGQSAAGELDLLAGRIGWRELYRRILTGERCAWKRVTTPPIQMADSGVQPGGRAGHAAAVMGCRVLLYGGEDQEQTMLGDTWLSNKLGPGIQLEWTRVSALEGPESRVAMSLAVLDQRVYVFGGVGGATGDLLDDTWCGAMHGEKFMWSQVQHSPVLMSELND